MTDGDAPLSPVQIVQRLYEAVQKAEFATLGTLVQGEVICQSNSGRGRGAEELFAALREQSENGALTVRQVVAQGGTVIVLGTVEARRDRAAEPNEFVHVWQLQEGRVVRVGLFDRA
jgi:ketosteroid isomerase-like protein